jgi:hypothetical protein
LNSGIDGASASQQQAGEENNKAVENVADSLHGCLRYRCFRVKYTTRRAIGQFPEAPLFVDFLFPCFLWG